LTSKSAFISDVIAAAALLGSKIRFSAVYFVIFKRNIFESNYHLMT